MPIRLAAVPLAVPLILFVFPVVGLHTMTERFLSVNLAHSAVTWVAATLSRFRVFSEIARFATQNVCFFSRPRARWELTLCAPPMPLPRAQQKIRRQSTRQSIQLFSLQSTLPQSIPQVIQQLIPRRQTQQLIQQSSRVSIPQRIQPQ